MLKQTNSQDYEHQFVHHLEGPELSVKQESQFPNNSLHQENNVQVETRPRKSKKYLQTNQIQMMNQKKKKLECFIEIIGEIGNKPIRDDIYEYCQKFNLIHQQIITKSTVLRLVKVRIDKMIKNRRLKKNWSTQDITILIWVISKHCQYYGIKKIHKEISDADWVNIAAMIPEVTSKGCMFKWLSLKISNLADNGWNLEQSLLLDKLVKQYGENQWSYISQQLYLKNPLQTKIFRCPKQCRQHWNCYLNPKLKKGPWDKKQDYLLLRAVKQLGGVKKWAQIVKLFNGRTQNALKNRFNLLIEKQQKDKNKKKLTQLQLIQTVLKKNQITYNILDKQKLDFLNQKRQQIVQHQKNKKSKKKNNPKTQKDKTQQLQKHIQQQQQDQFQPFHRQLPSKLAINLRSQHKIQRYQRYNRFYESIYHMSPTLKQSQLYFDNQSLNIKQEILKNQDRNGKMLEAYQNNCNNSKMNDQFQAKICQQIQTLDKYIENPSNEMIQKQNNQSIGQQQIQNPSQEFKNNPQQMSQFLKLLKSWSNISILNKLTNPQTNFSHITNQNIIIEQKVILKYDKDHEEQTKQQQIKILPFCQQYILDLQIITTKRTLYPCSIIQTNNCQFQMKPVYQ